MFDFSNIDPSIREYFEDTFIDIILESVGYLIYTYMFDYLEEMDKRVTANEMKFSLNSKYKGAIGGVMKQLHQKGYKVIVSDISNGERPLYGLSLLENSSGIYYKIKLQDTFQKFDINKKNNYQAELVNKKDSEIDKLLSNLFNMILKATNKEVFYKRIQDYLDSEKFSADFENKLKEKIGG